MGWSPERFDLLIARSYSQGVAANTCIFCGGAPLTREHLWPDWLRRELEIKVGFDWRIQQESEGSTTRDHAWTAPPFNQQVRAVCARCNSGWMSDIESAAKPILQALIRADGRQLHRRMQRTLATWGFLKACIFDDFIPRNVLCRRRIGGISTSTRSRRQTRCGSA